MIKEKIVYARFVSQNEWNNRKQESISRSMQLPYQATAFLRTDLFLVYLFVRERKVAPAQWHSDVN